VEVASISAERAEEVLFLSNFPTAAQPCRAESTDPDRIRCMLRVRFADDAAAMDTAIALYDLSGSVAGVERPQRMDGGWRGEIDLVPEPPIGPHRRQRHLSWMVDAYRDFDRFFEALAERAGKRTDYRYEPVELMFFRSVGRTTPSAYAGDWRIAWNVKGSLHTSADAVRETLFHETFHLNDRTHRSWSERALTPPFDEIVSRCSQGGQKPSTACLRPYAPNDTMVRGGTYYAFQPGNGVWEYSAELAIRYYREHRAILYDRPRLPAFKCGPAPNAATWRALVDEFFAGIDLVPDCTP
jgi:hypothetical protein